MFGFFKKKAPAPRPLDPLETFDQVIDSVERQGAEVRKSAATLLALRAELSRDQQKYVQRIDSIETRLPKAEGELNVETTLRRDLLEARRMLDRTTEAWAQAETDARLLMRVAEDLGAQLSTLKEERQSARARLSVGHLVSDALQAQVKEFDQLMKLDAARDEVEKAHALAELYREDADQKPR